MLVLMDSAQRLYMTSIKIHEELHVLTALFVQWLDYLECYLYLFEIIFYFIGVILILLCQTHVIR